MNPPSNPAREKVLGLTYATAAFLVWGVAPLYFVILAPSGPWEIVGIRVVFSFLLCAVLLWITRGWGRVRAILRQPRLARLTALAGVLIFINWQLYIIAVVTENVIEASLGYFFNPLIFVVMGVLFLKERLRPLQWAALGIAFVAVLVIAVGYGSVPWLALALALSFGVYGLIKTWAGPSIDALSGLTIETLWVLPIAAIEIIAVALTTGLTFGTISVGHTLLLAGAGVVTAVPLLLFASGARRISLTVTGMLQYIGPVMAFLIGVFILHEPMPLERWIGFVLIWVAVAIFSADALRGARQARRKARDSGGQGESREFPAAPGV